MPTTWSCFLQTWRIQITPARWQNNVRNPPVRISNNRRFGRPLIGFIEIGAWSP